MIPGLLRHRLAIDEPVTTQNETGEEVTTWNPRGKVWASIEPISGRELLRSSQIIGEIDTRIKIRWSNAADQIKAKWRGRHGSVIYNFKSVAHVKLAQVEIEIMASSGLNEG